MSPHSSCIGVAAALALAFGCEPLPEKHPRVVEAVPSGVVRSDGLRIAFTATEPLRASDVASGARVALCRAEDLREVKRFAESGAAAVAPIIEASVRLENGGRTVVVVPGAPLVPGTAYAALLAHGVRSTDGRLVLDAEGRPRTVVAEFTVSPELSVPARAEVTRVLADADAPEAGGEYVEVANLAEAPLDLAGFRLAKRGPTGAFTRCTIERRRGITIPPHGRGLVAGGAWDDRYGTPESVPLYACGSGAVAGGLANDRAPALVLEEPSGAAVSSFGVVAPAPLCVGRAAVRVDPAGPDSPANLACADSLAPADLW